MWEATWPKGPTTLTSTLPARLDLFEVLHNAQNTTLFSSPHNLSNLLFPSCPLLSTQKTTTTKTGPGQDKHSPESNQFWDNYYSLTCRWQAAWDGALMSVWRMKAVMFPAKVIRHTRKSQCHCHSLFLHCLTCISKLHHYLWEVSQWTHAHIPTSVALVCVFQ